MAPSAQKERIENLLKVAELARSRGQQQAALEALQEASQLDPKSEAVRASLKSLSLIGETSGFVDSLSKYIETGEETLGREILQTLKTKPLAPKSGVEALDLLCAQTTQRALCDELFTRLVEVNSEARKSLAEKLESKATVLFDQIFAIGPDSFRTLTGVPLDDSLWASEQKQKAAQQDVFQLAVAKLMYPDVAYPERIMKVIARQLAIAPQNVRGVIDEDVFDTILSSLDIRLKSDLRSQATIATAKLLEVLQDQGEALFARFVTMSVAKQTNEDLIIAFSAASSVFPMTPKVASKLFLTEGFVQQLVTNLERNSEFAHKGHRKSTKLERAALELLSAACVDKACREAVSKHCTSWLKGLMEDREGAHKSLAALILAKIGSESRDDISAQLANFVISSENEEDHAVEGLAYTTLQAKVKELVCKNETLVNKLVTGFSQHEQHTSMFGYLTVFYNLTVYRSTRTVEQKKIAQLKAYANSEKLEPDDPLDNDSHVTARCKKLLDAGLVPALVAFGKQATSLSLIALVVRILLFMSKEQKHRSKMTQQSAVKILLQIRDRVAKMDKTANTTAERSTIARETAHALARLLISVNPAHVFSSGLAPTTAVSAIIPLLSQDPDAEHRDLLPTFEGLLALTNLASMEDASARDLTIRSVFDEHEKLEELLFSPNVLIQRASVELLCNLMLSPFCIEKFADGSAAAKRRLQILLALADVEDLATRRAAGGALAMLTEWDAATVAILDKERGLKVLLSLCEDDNDELTHRGLVCLANMVNIPGEVGIRGVRELKAALGAEVIKEVLRSTRKQEILAAGVEVLKKLA